MLLFAVLGSQVAQAATITATPAPVQPKSACSPLEPGAPPPASVVKDEVGCAFQALYKPVSTPPVVPLTKREQRRKDKGKPPKAEKKTSPPKKTSKGT